jgi:enoyl-CoA hydratase
MALAKRCVDEGLERDPRGALATEILAIEESLAAAEWRQKMQDFA